MKKAYLGAKAKVTEIENADEAWKVGSASAMVMNGEKLVLANMGDYRAVVCKDGVAHQIGRKHRHTGKQSWIRRLISGICHLSHHSNINLSLFILLKFSTNNPMVS